VEKKEKPEGGWGKGKLNCV